MGAVLAATMVVTTPMAYAAPFDTGTGLAPTGELISQQWTACTAEIRLLAVCYHAIMQCIVALCVPLPPHPISSLYVPTDGKVME